MKSLTEIIDADGRRLPDPADPLLSALIAEILFLAEQVCVERDRLAAMSSTASGRALNDDEAENRLVEHTAFYAEIFGRLTLALDRTGSLDTLTNTCRSS